MSTPTRSQQQASQPRSTPARQSQPAPQTPTPTRDEDQEMQDEETTQPTQPSVTLDQVTTVVSQLHERIRELERQAATPVIKLQKPECFDGTRTKLRTFLTQMDAYLRMERARFPSEEAKVMFVSTFLRGPAMNWFEPIMRDRLGNDLENQDEITKEVFGDYEEFKRRLERTFGNVDETRTAERKLRRLRQTGSAAAYASEFQQVMSHLLWDESAQIALFESGLKNEIKREMIHRERPTRIDQMMELAIQIDNQIYEWQRDQYEARQWRSGKHRSYGRYQSNEKRRVTKRDPYGPEPMEIDATDQKNKGKKPERKCYYCDQTGHMVRNCKKRKQDQLRKRNNEKPQIKATDEISWDSGTESWEQMESQWTLTRDEFPEVELEKIPSGRARTIWRALSPGQSDDPVQEEILDPEDGLLGMPEQSAQTPGVEPEGAQDFELVDEFESDAFVSGEEDEAQQFRETCERNLQQLLVSSENPQEDGRTERQGPSEGLSCQCYNWNCVCWEATMETWNEHTRKCKNHGFTECPMHGYERYLRYSEAQEAVSCKKMWAQDFTCNWDECLCQHFTHLRHDRLPWTVCYDDDCTKHQDEKQQAGWFPKQPGETKGFHEYCPCNRERCSCSGYQRHPHHSGINWRWCCDDNCLIHWRAKDECYYPIPPRRMRQPKWKPEQQLAATVYGKHMKLEVQILGQSTIAMIDSGATGNFMSPRCQEELKILGREKPEVIPMTGIDGKPLGGKGLTTETGWIPMVVGDHFEMINFDVTELGQHSVILGIPWLKKHNPTIDWKINELQLDRCSCARMPKTRRPNRGNGVSHQGAELKGTTGIRGTHGGELKGSLQSGSEGRIALDDTQTRKEERSQALQRVAPERDEQVEQETPDEQEVRGECAQEECDRTGSRNRPAYQRRNATDEIQRAIREWRKKREFELDATEVQEPKIPEEYRKFRELFDQSINQPLPEHGPYDHEIPIMPGKEPVYKPIYQLSEKETQALKEYLDENLKKGWIRHSTSSAGYPILFVPKKDGSLRLCVDYRHLNSITVKDRYPLPLIAEIQDAIRGAKWFTKLDVADAYNRLRIKEGDEWKTAFRTKFGHFEYLVMPFGLTNAPATFQRYINSVLSGYIFDFVVAYLDDILIYSKTLEEHVQHVKKVLRRLGDAKLRLKLKKCEFHVQETDFLGHRITLEGIQTDKDKVQAILEWPIPTNVKELQSFIGLINYYRRYIEGYAKIMKPLFDLLRKDKAYEWTDDQQRAFDEAKKRITSAPILIQHDPEKPTTIETDASDYAIGARMTQPGQDGKPRPVAFYSRKLTPAELNYEIHDKELLAIVTAFRTWRVYLEGAKHTIQVISDHKNLTYFTTTKVLTRRQARWAEILANYDFVIKHCKGNENGQADALSRRADHEEGVRKPEPALLRHAEDGTMMYNHQVASLEATSELSGSPFVNKLIEETKRDEMIQRMLENSANNDKLTQGDDGIVYLHNLIYVPHKLRQEVIRMHHDPPAYGHMGIEKTTEHISRNYYFPNMRRAVERYIKNCDSCQRNKPARHQPYGKLQPLEAPKKPWEWITIDFITQLPRSKDSATRKNYDSIMVIVDRLTKYAHFLPVESTATAAQIAMVLLRVVTANHGMPRYITTDRDKLFISKLWKSWMDLLGVEHRLSTSYHPQTDGQTERTNQTIEQYLRHYLDYDQDNWVELLPVAQFAYNNAMSSTTGHTPFYANYGYHPQLAYEPQGRYEEAPTAKEHVDKLRQIHTMMQRDIDFVNFRMATYYDQKRSEGPDLKEGEKVYLLRRNIKTKRPSAKLDHIRLGPFTIEKKTGPVNYKLKLPTSMKIHPVFHISLLERAPANAKEPNNIELDETTEEEYEVEKILARKKVKGQIYYLVKWKGYDTSENTWEPIKNLTNCREEIRKFHQRRQTQTDSETSEEAHSSDSRSD